MLLLFEMGVIWDLHRNYIGLATKVSLRREIRGSKSLPMQGDLEGLEIPHHQGIHKELMEVWENIMVEFINLDSCRTRFFNNNAAKLMQMWILLKFSFIIKDRIRNR